MAREDWTGIVEAAYRLDIAEPDWVQCVADAIAPWKNGGFGVLCYVFDIGEGRLDMKSVAVAGVTEEIAGALCAALKSSPPGAHLPLLLHARPFGTMSTMPGLESTMEHMEANMGAAGIHDSYGLVARPHWRRGLVVGVNLPERRSVSPRELKRLAAAAAHLEAGLRLRYALGADVSLESPDVEAVLAPSGKVVHAAGEATPRTARDRLRDAARRIDRARGKVRHRDPDESLALWRGMVNGRWSLVDHFDSDGRRFVVARNNSVGMKDPRALTTREAQVAYQVSLGKTNAEAAYALGLSETTVRNHLCRAMSKLGLARRIDLVRVASAPVREALVDSTAGELAIRSAELPEARAEGTTAAENEVLRLLAEGLTNRQIAARRRVSERTVANQVAGLLRKFGAGTREELLRRVLVQS